MELPLLRLIVEHCDYSTYKTCFQKRLIMAVQHRKADVAEYLLPILEAHFTAKYLGKLLASSLGKKNEVLFRIILAYIEQFSLRTETPVTEIVNCRIVFWSLLDTQDRFDELYLLGFNVFIPYNGEYFVRNAIMYCKRNLFLRLFDLGLVTDSDLCFTIERKYRREHYRFLLRVNDILNTRDKSEDVLLRRYIPLQAVPLTASRALYREYQIHNQDRRNKRYAYHTLVYLNSLRPETNEVLATELREKRREKRKTRSPIH